MNEECRCFSLLTNAPVVDGDIVHVEGTSYGKSVAWAAYAQQYLGITLAIHARDDTQHLLQSQLKNQEYHGNRVQAYIDDPVKLFFDFFEKELTINS